MNSSLAGIYSIMYMSPSSNLHATTKHINTEYIGFIWEIRSPAKVVI